MIGSGCTATVALDHPDATGDSVDGCVASCRVSDLTVAKHRSVRAGPGFTAIGVRQSLRCAGVDSRNNTAEHHEGVVGSIGTEIDHSHPRVAGDVQGPMIARAKRGAEG